MRQIDRIFSQLFFFVPIQNMDLFKASFLGHYNRVESLIKKGIDINLKRSKGGCTALICACSEGNIEIVRLLVSCRADPTISDDTGLTPLQVAKHSKNAIIIEIMEEYVQEYVSRS